MDGTSNPQVEEVNNRDSSQTTNRFSLIRNIFQLTVEQLNVITPEYLLWVGEGAIIGYFLGYRLGYFLGSTPNWVTRSFPPVPWL